jgi:CHAT domain/Astacin (Peptidase family M12A)
MSKIVCRPRALTPEQAAKVLRRSVEINPENADEQRVVTRTPVGRRGGPRRLAVVIGNKWPSTGVRLTVQFLDSPARDLRARILLHMNAWSKTTNVQFVETAGVGKVRIARLDSPEDMAGYWSYIGTEIEGIEEDQPTFNLEGFTMRTSEAEFRRVVRHEAGHTLGFEHEHMRADLIKKIDRRKAIAYFDRTEGWTAQETMEQVLTPLVKKSIMGTTESDPHSVMCYQIPAEITKDGKEIPGGKDITPKDYAFAATIYPIPKPSRDTGAPEAPAVPDTGTTTPFIWTPPAAAGTPVAVMTPAVDADTFHVVVMDRFEPDVAGSAAAARRQKYARVFATYGGARVTIPMRLNTDAGEEHTHFRAIIDMHERIKAYTNREQGTLPKDTELIEFGTNLFETLFQGDVRRLYDEARSRQHGRKLDFVFTSMVSWIAEKPWEFAYDASRRSFLATEDIHFVRNVLTAIPADVIAPRAGPLRILVASAQPAGFGRLSVQQELEVIRRGFDPLIDAGLAEVEVLPRATPRSIHARLSTGHFTIVHFIGHGVFDEKTQEGSLVFEDASGGEYRLGERSVREIFCQRGVTLVFLNACQTGSGGRADFNKGVAQSLVAHGLPALVANQYSVLDSSATHFAQHFYWALAQGMTIGQAAREARIAVNYSLQGEMIDWAVPVVYARDPNMTLSVRPAGLTELAPARLRAPSRRAIAPRPVEVAVWDIDNVFPSLKNTLERLTGAQDQFGFDLVDLSAPIDAWDLEEKADDGTPYLWAEKLATRLSRMPLDLHVNVLACVTRHWLRDDETLNLYGWWPAKGGAPVLIFSVAGFEGLAPEGAATDRAIANVLVTGLAGYLAGIDAHSGGAKDCPMWANDARDIKHIVAPQKFDRGCRAKVAKAIPAELPALEALLKVFR